MKMTRKENQKPKTEPGALTLTVELVYHGVIDNYGYSPKLNDLEVSANRCLKWNTEFNGVGRLRNQGIVIPTEEYETWQESPSHRMQAEAYYDVFPDDKDDPHLEQKVRELPLFRLLDRQYEEDCIRGKVKNYVSIQYLTFKSYEP